MTEIRVMTMNDTLPSLHVPYPSCDHCNEEVAIEDGAAYCETCLVSWDRVEDGEVGKPDSAVLKEPEVACGIVVGAQGQPFESNGRHYIPGPPKPCILPAGHKDLHLNPYDLEVER